MKALLCKNYGPPETLVLDDIATPEPGPGQVVVAVEAVGINFPDTLIIENRYQFKPALPFAPGGEIAGVITKLGAGVTDWSVGDGVIAFPLWGGLVEEMVVDANQLLRKPDEMSFVEAAGFTMTYGTSLYALDNRGKLKAGETLLVLGASGGVGTAAIQIGKALGARVIAAVSSAEKAAVATQLGADDWIDYTRSDFKDALKTMTDGRGVDVILDPVGGQFSEPALRAIAWDGRFLVVGFAAGDIPRIPLNLLLLKGCAVSGVFWGDFLRRGERREEHLADLVRLYRDGKVKPHISGIFPLAEGGKAIRALADRKATGKVIVRIAE